MAIAAHNSPLAPAAPHVLVMLGAGREHAPAETVATRVTSREFVLG